MNGSGQTATVQHKTPTNSSRKTTGSPWLRAIRLVLLVIAVCLEGGRCVRWFQFQLTGRVTTLGNTYYLQARDRVITPEILASGAWEKNQTEELREILHPGDTFIDVGADFGWYTVIGAKIVGPTGRVIAFEPAPQNLEFLRRNVAANQCANVKIEPLALSNKSGKLAFHLSRDNLGDHSMLAAPDRPDAIEVQATTLDEYLRNDTGKIALIKIDTQGAEGFILDGMRDVLKKHPETIIFLEFTPNALRQCGYNPEAMLRNFHEQGYEIQFIHNDPGSMLTGPPQPRTVSIPESAFPRLAKAIEQDESYANLVIRKRTGR